ncbi:MAG TPA: 4-(cytidine 5'-diphospho)-2-C-methyl-D-erythritol kinase [Hyphomicrobiaceae bacterium]|nr:4-(cytidine 5'-diphospho)-2-C-methyl-D-erythritol kinase [Hyphomicrobiaceae bacterium]
MPTFNAPERIGEHANAKINLTLSVLGRRDDGYHELESLVAFATAADEVTIRPGTPHALTVGGTFAGAIAGENLLTTALALLKEADPHLRIGAVHLHKALPVAAGLGGGSADAAALLRAVRDANPERAGAIPWLEIAARLGSDVPVCFANQPALIRGRGERMQCFPSFPGMYAVLVNPRVPLSTASVFAALQAGPVVRSSAEARPLPQFSSVDAVLDYVGERRNDLEVAAVRLLPAIEEIKALLGAREGCRLAAMSGSGPTCFGIFSAWTEARSAGAAIAEARPDWWVEATGLISAP